jgi:short-subunit dehydrogenase
MRCLRNRNLTDLKNKIILVTGASTGIGEAIALAFDKEGARLALTSRRKEKLDALAAKLHEAIVIPADLALSGEPERIMKEVIAHYGRIDILVSNAACVIVSPAETTSAADLQKAFAVNLLAPVAFAQALFQFRKPGEPLQMIVIGSPGFKMGVPYYTPYASTKAALSGWTRSVQAEWENSGVIISEYFPGYVWTDSKAESRIGEVNQDLLMEENPGMFTRPQRPETVARQIVQLAKKPKTLVCSSWQVALGAYLSNIASFRMAITRNMVKNVRNKISSLKNPAP